MTPKLRNALYPLIKINLILLLFFLAIGGLYIAKDFLIPLAYATILAMLLIPVCNKLENKGINRGLATFICISILLLVCLGLLTFLSAQIAGFIQELPKIQTQFQQQLSHFQHYLQDTFGISLQQQKQAVQNGTDNMDNISSNAVALLGSFTHILTNALLILVYVFLLIYYRSRFSKFILKVVPEDQKQKAGRIITNSSHVAQQYLLGRGILIAVLLVMYSIGLLSIGIENAVFLSLLAALASIIPYVGNIIGIAFPLLMVLAQGGELWLFLGVLFVFAIAQFIESYILEPYIVGVEVDIHPFFTIVAIIAGQMIWGISGMILAIPLLGILKIIMQNIDSLKPYAYLIGDTTNTRPSTTIKNWFSSNN